MTFEEYQKEYLRILNGQFGGTMANLPPSLRSDALVTGIKGPRVEPICICSPYHKDDSGKIVIDPRARLTSWGSSMFCRIGGSQSSTNVRACF